MHELSKYGFEFYQKRREFSIYFENTTSQTCEKLIWIFRIVVLCQQPALIPFMHARGMDANIFPDSIYSTPLELNATIVASFEKPLLDVATVEPSRVLAVNLARSALSAASMATPEGTPDTSFSDEFGNGDLANRLWQGGLRFDCNGLSLVEGGSCVRLRRALSTNVNENTAEALVDEVESVFEEDARLLRATRTLARDTRVSHGVSAVHVGSQPSLLRVFLSVDALQPGLLNRLVNRMSEGGDLNLARATLASMKWLDRLVDGKGFVESLLSAADVMGTELKRDVIEALPEIVDDASRSFAVDQLVELMRGDPQLTDVVVDTLGALGVDSSRVEETNGAILAALSSAKPEMLPVTVRYLIATCPPSMLDDTIAGLRQNLASQSLGPAAGRLCLDALRSGLRMHKHVADYVLATLKRATESAAHRPSDVWFLVALLDSPPHRKAAEVMFRKKAAAGLFHETLVERAIAPFAAGFIDQTSRIIGLASICLKAAEPAARRTGVHIFGLIFRLFPNSTTACRDVLISLLEHTGCRRPLEVESALDALVAIASSAEKTGALIPHSATLQGLLDFLETFSDTQLRKIWTLFAYLCRASIHRNSGSGESARNSSALVGKEPGGDAIEDDDDDDDDDDIDGNLPGSDARTGAPGRLRRYRSELVQGSLAANEPELAPFMILLRKEVTHTSPVYRRIGILGVCSFVKLLPAAYAEEVFDLLVPAAVTAPSSEALAYDELAQAFLSPDTGGKEGSDKKTISFLCQLVADSFEKRFIADASHAGDKVEMPELKHELWFNLDGDDPDVCLPVSRYLVGKLQMSDPASVLISLAPHLRLLCVLMTAKSDSLEDIDAVLGCPLRLPRRDNVNNFGILSRPAKELVLGALFAGYAWLVEVVNAFASETDPELRAKCLLRMDHLLEMEVLISSCLEEMPTWRDALRLVCPSNALAHSGAHADDGNVGNGKQRDEICDSSGWMSLVRSLSANALSLISCVSPVSFSPSESVPESAEGFRRIEKSVRLSPAALERLLCELQKQVESGLSMDAVVSKGALGQAMLVSSSSTTAKSRNEKRGNVSQAGSLLVTSPLTHFQHLRTPLVALGPQLAASLRLMHSDGTTVIPGDDMGVDMDRAVYKRCVLLCLKCLAGTLSSDALKGNPVARELLFDVLAMVHFKGDSAPALSPSEPVGVADIELAAQKAYSQLWSKLDIVWGDIDDLDSMEDDGGDTADGSLGWGDESGSLGHFESVAALVAVLDAAFGLCSPDARAKGRFGVKLSDASGRLLERRWDDETLKSRKVTRVLPGVIRIYVQLAAEPLDAIKTVRAQLECFGERMRRAEAQKGRRDVDESDQEASLDGAKKGDVGEPEAIWGCITPKTFRQIYVSLLEQVLWLLKGCQNTDNVDSGDLLGSIKAISVSFNHVLELVRKEERVVGLAMRAGRNWVEVFMRVAMPLLRQNSNHHLAEVVEILKVQRGVIRILQQLCSHSKAIQDRSLSSLVPPLRKSLEVCLYKIREQLQGHRESGKVTLLFGTLATRDITGKKLTRNALVESAEELSDDLLEDEDIDVDETADAGGGPGHADGTENEDEGNGVIRHGHPSQLLIGSAKMLQKNRASQSQGAGARKKAGKKGQAGKNSQAGKKRMRESERSGAAKKSKQQDLSGSQGWASPDEMESEDDVGSDSPIIPPRRRRQGKGVKRGRHGIVSSEGKLQAGDDEDAVGTTRTMEADAFGVMEDNEEDGEENGEEDGEEDDSPVIALKKGNNSKSAGRRAEETRRPKPKARGDRNGKKRKNGGGGMRSKFVEFEAARSGDDGSSSAYDDGTFDSFLVDDDEDVE